MKPIRSILFLTLSAISFQTQAETWSLQLPEGDDRDEAIQSAIHDLKETANGFGISFERGLQESHRIIVERSSNADGLSPQGFEMGTVVDDKGFKTITLRGGSLVGEVNGLYWIWDRLRVHGGIPDLNLRREPALSVRLAGGENMESIRNALRYGATWVTGGDNLKLVPWGVEPEDTDNEKHREEIKKHIDLAHSYHLKFLSGCDELTYLPEYLKEMQATLTPEDPNLWKALQEKYRRLFKALPELDGVVIRTGELTRVFGNYRPFDIIHEPTGLDWSLERRYRTFVQKT